VSFAQSTTPFIPEVFVGKCYERNPSGANCSALWDAFSQAATLSNTQVTDADYAPFFVLSNFSTPTNGILFWSGNQAFALAISNSDNARFTTVEGTSTGYVLNGLSWCGMPNSNPPSFDFTDPCIYPSNSTYYGTQGVWAQCSKRFAQGATGKVTVLLQPTRLNFSSGPYQAYRSTSVFAQTELPSMNVTLVESVTILLLANYSIAPGEKCGNGTLSVLADVVKTKFGFSPTCIDDAQAIYKILCPDANTNTPECLAASLAVTQESGTPKKEQVYLIWALVATVAAAAFIVLTAYFAIRALNKSKSAF